MEVSYSNRARFHTTTTRWAILFNSGCTSCGSATTLLIIIAVCPGAAIVLRTEIVFLNALGLLTL